MAPAARSRPRSPPASPKACRSTRRRAKPKPMSAPPSPPPTVSASPPATARCIIFTSGGEQVSLVGEGSSHRRRRARLFERVGAGEGVERRQRVDDAVEGRERRGIDIEEFGAGRLAGQTNIGQRDGVAVSVAPGG